MLNSLKMRNKSLKSKSYNFTTKTNVLKFLSEKIKKSHIEKIFGFTVEDWKNNQDEILDSISKTFKKKIIVRSSAIGEDTIKFSGAGKYETIFDIKPNVKQSVKKAIKKVIESYNKKNNYNTKNQILVQNQTTNVQISGVVFTKTERFAAPYYTINFDESEFTDTVTKGLIGNTIKINRGTSPKQIPKKWKKLIISIKEIESVLNSDELDIEFGISNTRIIIFQVRPLTSITHSKLITNSMIQKSIYNNIKKFKKFKSMKSIPGGKTFFSDMSDWNPAEIIGNSPNALDYSLYNFLIMDESWHIGRSLIGYQNNNPYPLMVKFGNKPYVDIKASFNSLLPNNLNPKLKRKLIKFYMKKFALNPSLQDKIEFQILFTCFDFNLQNRLSELIAYGFSKKELVEIEHSLKELTNNIIQNFDDILQESNKSIITLEKNREKTLLNIKNSSKNHRIMLQSIEKLLNDCKIYGTIPFSRMARIAFISNIMLKSLTEIGKIDKKFEDVLMQSISTPLPKFQEDASNYVAQKISRKEFLSKYGHLRPGTYDITALRYDQDERFLRGIKFKKKNYSKSKLSDLKIDDIFKNNGIEISEKEFYDFLKKSIASREQLKFEFTKNLSEVLEIIAEIGNFLGFSRKELANLNIKQIISSRDFTRNKITSHWKNLINLAKNRKNVNELIVLPPIIFSEEDFNLIQYYRPSPNFITNKRIVSKIELLNNSKKNIPDLEGKIVLVENADPGYDWIFTQNSAGLITKYGGIASHMAIRCAEINLPAAIGCGDSMFEKLKKSSKIMLDCKNKQILILEHVLDDESIEERKVLKSLGYIK